MDSKNHHSDKSSLSSHKSKGRIKTPDEDMDFKEAVNENYSGTIRSNYSPSPSSAIDDDLEPMSLEDEQAFTKIINSEVNNEIKKIRNDNSNREYKYNLEKLQDSHISKLEVKDFYDGKCQICNYTFITKKGINYCITPNLLEKRKGGVRHPANYLCLCPNHYALLKYGNVELQDLDNLKGNKIKFSGDDEWDEIKYSPLHFTMLKAFLNRKKG
jgi:hypothetical protein